MKIYDTDIAGVTCHLCMNAAALFDIYDKYGTAGSVLDPIRANGKQGFEATCWMLWKLSEQGEIVRRWLGHEAEKIPTEARFRALLGPEEANAAREAIAVAVGLGFAREVPDGRAERGIDLGLLALQKKTEVPTTAASFSTRLRRCFTSASGRR